MCGSADVGSAGENVRGNGTSEAILEAVVGCWRGGNKRS